MADAQVNSVMQLVSERKIVFVPLVIGLILLAVGAWVMLIPDQPAVEVVKKDEVADDHQSLWVDVEGAVERPGVYELSKGARVNQALTAAGGLAADADRTWVARFVNQAEPVKDGAKIFIPKAGQMSEESKNSASVLGAPEGGVNINTASRQDLDGLWGVGEKRADDIINNRPYGDVEELVTKAGIPRNVFEKIKLQVVVY